MTTEELIIAITDLRKETEDLILSNIVDAFNIQYGEYTSYPDETHGVSLSVPFLSTDDYVVSIFSAIDSDGANIVDSLEIINSSSSGFTIYSPRAASIKWQASRRTPKINFWTV